MVIDEIRDAQGSVDVKANRQVGTVNGLAEHLDFPCTQLTAGLAVYAGTDTKSAGQANPSASGGGKARPRVRA